jgi:hypothetical protein
LRELGTDFQQVNKQRKSVIWGKNNLRMLNDVVVKKGYQVKTSVRFAAFKYLDGDGDGDGDGGGGGGGGDDDDDDDDDVDVSWT